MPKQTWMQLSDAALEDALAAAIRDHHASSVKLLGLVAAVEARKLYLPAAYSSMFTYCVGRFGLTRDVAYKLIHAARAALRYPTILGGIEQGRLTVSVVASLARHLNHSNAAELLAWAEGKTRREVREYLAARFPNEVGPCAAFTPSAPAQSGPSLTDRIEDEAPCVSPATPPAEPAMSCEGQKQAPAPVDVGTPVPWQQPSESTRPHTRLELTLDQASLGLLHRARDLMSHQVPSGDASEIFKRALALLVEHLEQQKFAATDSPRTMRASKNPRHIPAHVKRAVRERDRDQCTFVSETGRRCEETRLLEFDHDREVARGGEATVANVRLRCRAHNQFTAERTYGEGFMQRKRELAKARAAARRARRAAREREDSMRAAAKERALEEIPWLGEMTRRATEAVTRQPDPEPPPLPS